MVFETQGSKLYFLMHYPKFLLLQPQFGSLVASNAYLKSPILYCFMISNLVSSYLKLTTTVGNVGRSDFQGIPFICDNVMLARTHTLFPVNDSCIVGAYRARMKQLD